MLKFVRDGSDDQQSEPGFTGSIAPGFTKSLLGSRAVLGDSGAHDSHVEPFGNFSSGSYRSLGDKIIVPDAQLLFSAQFKRSGNDLILLGEDGRKLVVHDYFKSEKRATLVSPEGATLTGRIIELLAGSNDSDQYAQATAPAGGEKPIGRVVELTGIATATRNGVTVQLNVGDPVLKGDVVET